MSDFVNLMRGYWNNNHIGLVPKERLLEAHHDPAEWPEKLRVREFPVITP